MSPDLNSEMGYESESDHSERVTQYFAAARANDVAQVRKILKACPKLVDQRIADLTEQTWRAVDAHQRHSNTVLHWTTTPWGQQSESHVELAQALIDHGADVDALGYNENKGVAPAVVLAAWEGELGVLRALLDSGANPNKPGSAESALYCAIEHTAHDAPKPNKVSILLDNGAEHDIFTAAMVGRIDLVEQFIEDYHPLIDRRSLKRNRTPIEEAVAHGQWDVARQLITLGAAVTVHVASAMGNRTLLKKLVEGAPGLIESYDDNHATPLFVACECGRRDVVDLLLDLGANPDTTNRWGTSALHVATQGGSKGIVAQLLSVGADKAVKDRYGKVPLEYVEPSDQELYLAFK